MQTKKFGYQIDIEAVPYNTGTAKYLFGEDASYLPDYSEHTIANEYISDLFQDAITYVLQAKCLFLSQHKIQDLETMSEPNKSFWAYLEEKEQRYRDIQRTIKPLGETK